MDSEENRIELGIRQLKSLNSIFKDRLTSKAISIKDPGRVSQLQDPRRALMEFDKFIQEYNRQYLKEIHEARLVISPFFYRSIREHLSDPDFMRLEHEQFGLKFVFSVLQAEHLMHVELYRQTGTHRETTVALSRLEDIFLQEVINRYPEGMMTREELQVMGRALLREVAKLMTGEIRCAHCGEYMAYNRYLKAIMPPVIRELTEGSEVRREERYLHQECF